MGPKKNKTEQEWIGLREGQCPGCLLLARGGDGRIFATCQNQKKKWQSLLRLYQKASSWDKQFLKYGFQTLMWKKWMDKDIVHVEQLLAGNHNKSFSDTWGNGPSKTS